ncbi:MAG: GNAT family N-acetyltransferase [Armatimonadetes bacterium]|nr:GNAT family N-acetyltransferase [Armatimonadota bacterium]
MHVAVRPATAEDGTTLVRVFDAAYGGGYSATFDHDGPLAPRDVWFAHAEKDVGVIEVDRRPAGLLVVGRGRGQWLVEDALVPAFGELPARAQEALVTRMAAHLVGVFQRGRQDALLLRAAETNVFGLALAHAMHAAFTNGLLVFRYRGPKRPSADPPEGYHLRRAAPDDARTAGRLVREVIPERTRAEEIASVLTSRDGRGYLAWRESLLVGFAAVELRAGRGDWVVGVRETHRGRGVGRALAAAAIGALTARGLSPFAAVWALDAVAGPFLRALGFAVERTYLYMERPL